MDILIKPDAENAVAVYAALVKFDAPLEGLGPDDLVEKGKFFRMGTPPVMEDIMKKIIGIFMLALLGCSHAYASDGFEKVRCNGDIAKALVGQRGSNEPVMAIEGRHKDLGLKDLGASDDNGFSSITWLICGTEFMVLEDDRTDIIHDVLQIPPHSKSNPEFQGLCKLKGKVMRESVVAILRDQSGQDELPADAAWKIDERAVKFVKMPTDDLLCPRDGILGSRSRLRP